jgi:hypothetical protein
VTERELHRIDPLARGPESTSGNRREKAAPKWGQVSDDSSRPGKARVWGDLLHLSFGKVSMSIRENPQALAVRAGSAREGNWRPRQGTGAAAVRLPRQRGRAQGVTGPMRPSTRSRYSVEALMTAPRSGCAWSRRGGLETPARCAPPGTTRIAIKPDECPSLGARARTSLVREGESVACMPLAAPPSARPCGRTAPLPADPRPRRPCRCRPRSCRAAPRCPTFLNLSRWRARNVEEYVELSGDGHAGGN